MMKSPEACGSFRVPALASTAVTLWLAGRSVATALVAAALDSCTTGVAAGVPTGLMLKSVLMAASWPPSSKIPTPLLVQLWQAALNVLLENTVNAALKAALEFYENVAIAGEARRRAIRASC